MHYSKLALSFSAALTAVILLAACAGRSSTSPMPDNGLIPLAPQALLVDTTCTASVWASSLQGSPPGVQGYTKAGILCGPLITGSSSPGGPLVAPYGLATDRAGDLYVADVNNSRVVVFKRNGAYLTTMNMTSGYQPFSVCVSPSGVVGVVDRNAVKGKPGDVEFFKSYRNSTMTGDATGVLNTFNWCAFDKRGNFFADGTTSGGAFEIVYLAHANVGKRAQTVLDSMLGSGTDWLSMYVQKPGNLLSVGGDYEIQNFKINAVTGQPSGPPTITTLTQYPKGRDPFYQAAPSAGGGSATIYIADYGESAVLQAPVGGSRRTGGPVTPFALQLSVVGIATHPTGQY